MGIIMDKETWIRSRTNNPDKLGKGVWGSLYEIAIQEMKGRKIPTEVLDTLKPLYMDMAREYLAKMGISTQVNESNWKMILGYMKNLDLLENTNVVRLVLKKNLQIKKIAPQPLAKEFLVSKEAWIQSRTSTPDRLGKNVWGSFYDLTVQEMNGRKIPPETKKTLKPLYMDMAREYLSKIGVSSEVNESNYEYILGYMKNMDSLENPEAIKLGLTTGLKMLAKKNRTKESLFKRLKNNSRHFFFKHQNKPKKSQNTL